MSDEWKNINDSMPDFETLITHDNKMFVSQKYGVDVLWQFRSGAMVSGYHTVLSDSVTVVYVHNGAFPLVDFVAWRPMPERYTSPDND